MSAASFTQVVAVAAQRNGRDLALLRRGTEEGQRWMAAGLVEEHVEPGEDADLYYVVGGLAAHYPALVRPSGLGRSIGSAYRALAARATSVSERRMYETEMGALLAAPASELPRRLRHVLGVCAKHKMPIDLGLLLTDVLRWEDDERIAQHGLARDMWG